MKFRLLRLALLAFSIVALALLAAAVALVWDGLHDRIQKADVALVLGNKVELDGKPSARLKTRLDRALEIFKDGKATAIIVSGATGKEGFDEAQVMADYLSARGVPPGKIIADSHGVTTEVSAINTAAILRSHGWSSALVVSQYFHIPRAKLALERAGVSEVYSAHAHIFELRDLYSIPREMAGYVSYSLRKFDPPQK